MQSFEQELKECERAYKYGRVALLRDLLQKCKEIIADIDKSIDVIERGTIEAHNLRSQTEDKDIQKILNHYQVNDLSLIESMREHKSYFIKNKKFLEGHIAFLEDQRQK